MLVLNPKNRVKYPYHSHNDLLPTQQPTSNPMLSPLPSAIVLKTGRNIRRRVWLWNACACMSNYIFELSKKIMLDVRASKSPPQWFGRLGRLSWGGQLECEIWNLQELHHHLGNTFDQFWDQEWFWTLHHQHQFNWVGRNSSGCSRSWI